MMKNPSIATTAMLLFGLVFGACKNNGMIIKMDGSSTVFPITEAVAEEFQKQHETRVTIGVSGSGGGFKKFCNHETDFSNASRPIKLSEVEQCRKNHVEYIELPIAYDGIAVVVHKDADWVDTLSVAELRKLWLPSAQGKLTHWNQLRPSWPEKEIHLFGPGIDSGTYDYFTEAIVGEEHSSRGDFTSSEDDNVLVQGISGDKYALGFFGLAYYIENRDKLKVVPIRAGDKDPVSPSFETVADGRYQPLSRPLFVYVNKQVADRKDISAFVRFMLERAAPYIREVGYIPLPSAAYALVKERFTKRITGSLFGGKGSQVGVKVEELLQNQ